MIFIGLCGLPAGGKSAVAATLEQLGAVWVNADRIAHRVLELSDVRQQIVRQFGSTILLADGKIDRPRLAAMVFGDDASAGAALRYLESVVHPGARSLMTTEIAAALQAEAPAVVLDVPLLFESHWDLWCDEIWYVDTPRSTRLAAAADRGWTAEMLDQRASRQLDPDEKRRLASRIIDNHGTLEQLKVTTETSWTALVKSDTVSAAAAHCRDALLATQRL